MRIAAPHEPVPRAVRNALAASWRAMLADVRSAPALPCLRGAAQAAAGWALAAAGRDRPVLWICDGAASLEACHEDFAALRPDGAPPLIYFPEREELPGDARGTDPEVTGLRFRALDELLRLGDAGGPAPVVIACVQSLMQRTAAPGAWMAGVRRLRTGDELAPEDFARTLLDAGYERAIEVDRKGQFAHKGGILDVWPPASDWPARIELLGDAIESLRLFDPTDQRTRGAVVAVDVTPARDPAGAGGGLLTDYLGAPALVVWCDRSRIAERASILEEAQAEAGASAAGGMASLAELREAFARRADRQIVLDDLDADTSAVPFPDLRPVEDAFALPPEDFRPDAAEARRQALFAALTRLAVPGRSDAPVPPREPDSVRQRDATHGWTVRVCFDTSGALEHYRPRLLEAGVAPECLTVSRISGGVVSGKLGLVLLGEADIVGRRKRTPRRYDPHGNRPRPAAALGRRVTDASEIEPGELVVHADHGLGRYEGVSEIVFQNERQEVLTIEYADEARLHVPVSHAHLLTRYMGLARHAPALHRLGGRRWSTEKAEAEQAVLDLSASLLETEAARAAQGGESFGADTAWQSDFEMAFPYRETEDQARAIEETKRDLESPRPTDRLICGDAGYGKTEVAMRAAFKAVMAGRQVAVLVPTTVLAQQHVESFSDRMAGYPVRIETLSRFAAPAERRRTLAGMEDGSVDIVIGTHALLQPSVRFKRLGLVIIDEEQRFGVRHKERFKQVRRLVDVLTMTATPIPRTLYMSMTGARDMSLIRTPPEERMAIETIVAKNTDDIVRKAILRELNREGQAFYLHNRILTIERAAGRIARLAPEARILVAHGRMAADELSDAMHRFVAREFDVLVCTTIIESGVDIPNANTILIDRADRFGIAELYQLRGRVGRSNHKAYAYFLLPESGRIESDARQRIAALKRHSGLGAGFSLALRDLEIRGAGNLLGARQSGHIAAVGFDLYCQLLRRSIARLKGEPAPPLAEAELALDFIGLSPSDPRAPGAASIPYDYVEDEALRVGLYGRLARATETAEAAALREELRDRFGPPPPSVNRLIDVALLRIESARRGLRRVEVRHGVVRLWRDREPVMPGGRFPRLTEAAPDAMLDELRGLVSQL